MTDMVDPDILLSCKMKRGFEKILGVFFEMCGWVVGLATYFAFVAFLMVTTLAMITLRFFNTGAPDPTVLVMGLFSIIIIMMAFMMEHLVHDSSSIAVKTACYGAMAGTVCMSFFYGVVGVSAASYWGLMKISPLLSYICAAISIFIVSFIIDVIAIDITYEIVNDEKMKCAASTVSYVRTMELIMNGVVSRVVGFLKWFLEKTGTAIVVILYGVYIIYSVWTASFLYGATAPSNIIVGVATFGIMFDFIVVLMGLAVLHGEWQLKNVVIGGGVAASGLVAAACTMTLLLMRQIMAVEYTIVIGVISAICLAYPIITLVCWVQIAHIKRKNIVGARSGST